MDELGDSWARAAERARLTDVEQRRLAIAVYEDEGLREELTYLLEQLSTDVSGLFPREFVDHLSNESAGLSSGQWVRRALEPVGSRLVARAWTALSGGGWR